MESFLSQVNGNWGVFLPVVAETGKGRRNTIGIVLLNSIRTESLGLIGGIAVVLVGVVGVRVVGL